MSTKQWIAVLGTLLGAFMAVLDIQITNSSLGEIAGGISATPNEASWISTAYLIAEIVTIPLTVWLSHVFTMRWYLLVNLILFLLFSALCGLATSLGEMILFRAAQGFTGGVFIPLALTVIFSTMPKRLQPLGQALFGITATLAPCIGPTLGGWLTDVLGWEWNFYINLIPGAVMFAAIWFTYEREKPHFDELARGDWAGIVCMTIGLGSLVAMLEEGQRKDWFGSQFIVICAVLTGVFLPAFIVIELVRKEPFVNIRLLRDRNLLVSCLVVFILGLGLYGSIFLIPLYLGQIQGYSPLQIGETLMWVGLPQLLIFPILPLLMKRIDVRLLACFGCLIFALSCFFNAYMSPDYAGAQFTLSNVIRALGQPFTIVSVTALALASLPKKDSGDASAIFNIFRNLGGSAGIAILATMITRREQFHDWRIGEHVTAYNPATWGRLNETQSWFIARGLDSDTASQTALKALKESVTHNASIMAYSDAFLVIAIALLLAAVMILFTRKPDYSEGSVKLE